MGFPPHKTGVSCSVRNKVSAERSIIHKKGKNVNSKFDLA